MCVLAHIRYIRMADDGDKPTGSLPGCARQQETVKWQMCESMRSSCLMMAHVHCRTSSHGIWFLVVRMVSTSSARGRYGFVKTSGPVGNGEDG